MTNSFSRQNKYLKFFSFFIRLFFIFIFFVFEYNVILFDRFSYVLPLRKCEDLFVCRFPCNLLFIMVLILDGNSEHIVHV